MKLIVYYIRLTFQWDTSNDSELDHQSSVHLLQAIVLGLIDLTYIGLTCNDIGIRNTH